VTATSSNCGAFVLSQAREAVNADGEVADPAEFGVPVPSVGLVTTY
jgi:hypothetical protein